MARVGEREYENPVKIENIDPAVCQMMGGKVGKDGKCKVRMKVSTDHPKQVEMSAIEDDELLSD